MNYVNRGFRIPSGSDYGGQARSKGGHQGASNRGATAEKGRDVTSVTITIFWQAARQFWQHMIEEISFWGDDNERRYDR